MKSVLAVALFLLLALVKSSLATNTNTMDQFNSVITEYDAKTAEIVTTFKKASAILKGTFFTKKFKIVLYIFYITQLLKTRDFKFL